ncbi:hypothetical protein QTO34_001677 [Cnephaeus nilssonii]|uniref:Uncharacterized protein n=1 Tax=Cnephaeus nilssonii TaxID=3371016 RepID=A0AA40HU80_CNENI|nr:hypothetical protein QTO34_001677 [Eptesicus nilssonii]
MGGAGGSAAAPGPRSFPPWEPFLGFRGTDPPSPAKLGLESTQVGGSPVFPERDSCFSLQMSFENEEMRARTRSKALRGECRLPVVLAPQLALSESQAKAVDATSPQENGPRDARSSLAGPGSKASGGLGLWAPWSSPGQSAGRGARQTQLHGAFPARLGGRAHCSEGPGACVGRGRLSLQSHQPSQVGLKAH